MFTISIFVWKHRMGEEQTHSSQTQERFKHSDLSTWVEGCRVGIPCASLCGAGSLEISWVKEAQLTACLWLSGLAPGCFGVGGQRCWAAVSGATEVTLGHTDDEGLPNESTDASTLKEFFFSLKKKKEINSFFHKESLGRALAVQWLGLSAFTNVAWVQSLVGGLRSHNCATAQPKKNKNKQQSPVYERAML